MSQLFYTMITPVLRGQSSYQYAYWLAMAIKEYIISSLHCLLFKTTYMTFMILS